MNKTAEFLRGKKTYGVALVGGLYLLGCYVGWFVFDEKVCAALGIGFVATFRSALNGIILRHDSQDSQDGKGNPVNRVNPVLLLGLGLFLAIGGEGCAMLDKAATGVTRAQVTTTTNSVSQVVTNFVPIPVRIDVPGPERFVTNIVERVTTNVVERMTTVTNFVVKEGIAEGLQTARAGAAVAGVFNPGAGAMAAAGVGITGGLLGLLAAYKNKRAKDAAEGQAAEAGAISDDMAAQLEAVIKGVEQLDPEAGKKAKAVIAAASKELGVSDALHATVRDLTEAKIS